MSCTSASASSFVAKQVCPSCHRNSRVRKKGTGCLNSHLTTLFHWLIFNGRSLWLRIHFLYVSYIIVSDVGRMASRSGSLESPASVTHATSGEKPSMCDDSFFKSDSGMNSGKYAFCTPRSLNPASKTSCNNSHILYAYGLITRQPETGEYSIRPAFVIASVYQVLKSSFFFVLMPNCSPMVELTKNCLYGLCLDLVCCLILNWFCCYSLLTKLALQNENKFKLLPRGVIYGGILI